MIKLTEQQDNFRIGALSHKHTIARADPGTGKTTTVCTFWQQVEDERRRRGFLLAYNKHAEKALKKVLGDQWNIKTQDGFTWRFAGKLLGGKRFDNWNRDNFRTKKLVGEYGRQYWDTNIFTADQIHSMDDLLKFVDLVISNCINATDHEAVVALGARYGAECGDMDFIEAGVPTLIQWVLHGCDHPLPYGEYAGRRMTLHDSFSNDALTYLLATDPRAVDLFKRERIPLIGMDEIQDTSPAMAIVLMRALGDWGQFVGIGDPGQALYYFRGVPSDQFGAMVHAWQADLHYLDLSFRLPKAGVGLARCYFPRLRVPETAIEGATVVIQPKAVAGLAKPGSACIFHTNVQAIGMAYFLLRHGVPAVVIGSDVGKDIEDLLETLVKRKGFSYNELPTALEEWAAEETTRAEIRYKDPEQFVIALQERAKSLLYIYDGAWDQGARDIGALRQAIRDLFKFSAEGTEKVVVCSTIHRAKGLEWRTVFTAEADLGVEKWKTAEEANQVKCAKGVSVTRHLETHFMVGEEEVDVPRRAARLL